MSSTSTLPVIKIPKGFDNAAFLIRYERKYLQQETQEIEQENQEKNTNIDAFKKGSFISSTQTVNDDKIFEVQDGLYRGTYRTKDAQGETVTHRLYYQVTEGNVTEINEQNFRNYLNTLHDQWLQTEEGKNALAQSKSQETITSATPSPDAPQSPSNSSPQLTSSQLDFGAYLFEKVTQVAQANPKFHFQGQRLQSLINPAFDLTKPLTLEVIENGKSIFNANQTVFKGIYNVGRQPQILLQQDPQMLSRLDKYVEYLETAEGTEVDPKVGNMTMKLNGTVIFRIKDGQVTVNKLQPEVVQALTIHTEKQEGVQEMSQSMADFLDQSVENEQLTPESEKESEETEKPSVEKVEV